jgi:hypothetical protein
MMLAASRGVRDCLAPPLFISFESVNSEVELYLSTASAVAQIGCYGVLFPRRMLFWVNNRVAIWLDQGQLVVSVLISVVVYDLRYGQLFTVGPMYFDSGVA